ncbi:hypothetical protein J3R82DRAFT_7197 [Butyriboletus roseoflavus]|nr:hypothetical protein J3R82DRAFT_7197 [Butyriboletus roseoflavus]
MSSPSSPVIYVPIHRRTPSSSPSPSSSRALSPSPAPPIAGVYTPAELLLLSTSPLAKLSAEHVDALRAHVPEVVQTRKQRKALAWHARRPTPTPTSSPTHKRTGSYARASSESEEDRATTWRI